MAKNKKQIHSGRQIRHMSSKELSSIPTTRVPVCLVLDTSGTMCIADGDSNSTRIASLNKGIETFLKEVKSDEIARYAVDLCVIQFDSTVNVVQPFKMVSKINSIPQMEASGCTKMGEAVNMALDLLDGRKKQYKMTGAEYWQPILVLMSDGAPNGNPDILRKAICETNSLVKEKKLSVFPIGIGEGADLSLMSGFGRRAVSLQNARFNEFFVWLSQSVKKTSYSNIGDDVELPPIDSWGKL